MGTKNKLFSKLRAISFMGAMMGMNQPAQNVPAHTRHGGRAKGYTHGGGRTSVNSSSQAIFIPRRKKVKGWQRDVKGRVMKSV